MTAAQMISLARKTLVMDHPFWGALALRLKIVEDPSCGTAWTDSVSLGYDPAFILSLPQIQVLGTVAHEVGHCILSHCFRRGNRDPYMWNVACDYALNHILIQAGFTLPDGALLRDDFAGRSAEWIYDRLMDERPTDDGGNGTPQDSDEDGTEDGDEDGTEDGDDSSDNESSQDADDADDDDDADSTTTGGGGGTQQQDPAVGEVRDAPVSDGDEAAAADLEQEWKEAVIDAATLVDKLDGLNSGTQRVVDDALTVKVDWRHQLQQFAQEIATQDYSWEHMDERFIDDDIFVPTLHSEGMGHLVTVIDTSGSVDRVTLAQYQVEARTIVETCSPSHVTIIYCDYMVQHVETYEAGDPIVLAPHGGGWTDFAPPFEWVDEHLSERPAALIYLTDLQPCGGGFPDREPDYPVLWAATGHRTAAPFGEVIKVE